MKRLVALLLTMLALTAMAQKPIIDKNGFNGIHLGELSARVPKCMPGFYTSTTRDVDECTGVLTICGKKHGSASVCFYMDGNANTNIDGIWVNNPENVCVKVKGITIPGNSTASQLMAIIGARASFVYWYGLSIYIDGVTFFFDLSALSPRGVRKKNALEEFDKGVELNASDFISTARPIGVICGCIPTC